jgi:hypothetical protein
MLLHAVAVFVCSSTTAVAVVLSVDTGDIGGVLGVLKLVPLHSRSNLRLRIMIPVITHYIHEMCRGFIVRLHKS